MSPNVRRGMPHGGTAGYGGDASHDKPFSVMATVGVGSNPQGVAVNLRTYAVYVADQSSNTVSVLTP